MTYTYSHVHGLRQLTGDTENDASCLKRSNEKRMKFGVDQHSMLNCKKKLKE